MDCEEEPLLELLLRCVLGDVDLIETARQGAQEQEQRTSLVAVAEEAAITPKHQLKVQSSRLLSEEIGPG